MKTDVYYGEDLAALHDAHYSGLSVAVAEMLLQNLKDRHLPSGMVVDLGCGSGKLVKILSDHGYDTIGVDLSKDLLDIARSYAPWNTFIEQSMWDFELPACVAVTAIGEIINYTFDHQNTDEHIETLFREVYHCLENSGIFLFDFVEPDIIKNGTKEPKVVEEEGWTTLVTYHENKALQELVRDITVFRKNKDGVYRKSREIHRIRQLDASSLTERLQEIGFEIKVLGGYGNITFKDSHKAILACKSP
jgi:SAM-dependent methyltransferase